MEAFQLFIVEQKTSKVINIIWKSKFRSVIFPDSVEVEFDVLELERVGENNCVISSKIYQGVGMVDTMNEDTLPYTFTPGITYTVKASLRNVDQICAAEYPSMMPVQSTFTKRKILII